MANNTLYVPCTDGLRAITIDGAGHSTVRWRAIHAAGSPVVGGAQIWVVDYDGGLLYTLDPATGAVCQQIRLAASPHFASPTLARNHGYIGTLTGVVAVGWG